ncbi:MAG: reverse transcriptase domain-containing protein [Pseudomonadota bacterium]
MHRSSLGLDEVIDWANLSRAFFLASRGKRGRADVESFRQRLEVELAALRTEILSGDLQLGPMTRFEIRDPKPRMISAPPFRERVLHHAIMQVMGPELEKSLIANTFACRIGKGPLVAIRHVQKLLRRRPWYIHIDIRSYFPSISHVVLLMQLKRRFKNRALLDVVTRIVAAHKDAPGRGLPIGALTSQNFANFYLAKVDRLIQEDPRVGGYVRYMDDLIWSSETKDMARNVLADARAVIENELLLTIKKPFRLGRSCDGVVFCGYRILPDQILLSRRKKRRYSNFRSEIEKAFCDGRINAAELQRRYDAIQAVTMHADAKAWRKEQLLRCPLAPMLVEV